MTLYYWFYVYLTFKWLDGLVDSIRRDIILIRLLIKSFILGVDSIVREISIENGVIYLFCKRRMRFDYTLNGGG